MNFKSLQLGRALGLVVRTSPILGIRLGAYLIFWLIMLLYFGLVGGIAYLIGNAIPCLGLAVFIVAFVGVVPIYKLAYRYVFYLLKAAHIAILAELLTRNKLPAGVNQLSWGKQQVEERFGEVNAMFVVDEIVAAIVRRFTYTVYRLASWLPSDTLQMLVALANRVVHFAINYIDEAILARSFYQRSDSVWANARDGVVLYAMVWKPLIANAIALMLLSYVPFFVVFLLIAVPVGFGLALVSATLAGWALIILLVLAVLLKIAIGDTVAMTAMIASYQRETANLVPDPNVTAKLESVSTKFKELLIQK